MRLAGMTQIQLAERVGCTQGYISKLKNGRYRGLPPDATMRALADAFGCTQPDLFPALADRRASERRDGERRDGDRRVGSSRDAHI